MKRILITGADGFIGSHLTELMLQEGYQVKALSYYNSFNNWGWLEEIPPHDNLQIVTGDIRDPFFSKELSADIDLIFHLAALIAIPYSYIAPESFVETNIKGTLNICQAAKNAGNIRVIHTSTSEVYGTALYVPIDEKHPKQPLSPYSASKIGADAIALSFYNSFQLPVTIVRPFNTFGPRQSARAVIPSVIIQIAAGRTHIKTGNLAPVRDFNYVTDICRGFLAAAKSDKTIGREINLCTNREISVGDTVRAISSIMGAEITIETEPARMRPDSSEVFRLKGDNSLVKELTGWEPSISFDEGLRKTIDWFSDPVNLKKYKPEIFNI